MSGIRYAIVVVILIVIVLCILNMHGCLPYVCGAPAPAHRETMTKPPWMYILTGQSGRVTITLGPHGDYLYHFKRDGTYTAVHHAYATWRVAGSWRWLPGRQVLQVTEPEHATFIGDKTPIDGMSAKPIVREWKFYSRRGATTYHPEGTYFSILIKSTGVSPKRGPVIKDEY